MLEVVSVKRTFRESCIRSYSILDLYDLEINAFLCEDRLSLFKYLSVRC